MQKQFSVAVSISRSQPVDENRQVKIRADVGILFGRGVCLEGKGTEGAEGLLEWWNILSIFSVEISM